MRIMVFMMRYMNRYLGVVARPLVRLMAEGEVIACGLRGEDGGVRVIYSPRPGRGTHSLVGLEAGSSAGAPTRPEADFSGGLVRQVLLPEARVGDLVLLQAENAAGRVLNSPRITVKEETLRSPGWIDVAFLPGGEVRFSWPRAKRRGVMVYFLALEDAAGSSLAGVYTREQFWTYPRLKSASLSIGPEPPPPLEAGAACTARLVVVDFDGWVSRLGVRSFTCPAGRAGSGFPGVG